MDRFAIYARIEAAPGKEQELEKLLKSAQSIVEEERGTTSWYLFRTGPTTFGIFDTFADESGRDAHLNGRVVEALNANAALLGAPPQINKLDVLASKEPRSGSKAA